MLDKIAASHTKRGVKAPETDGTGIVLNGVETDEVVARARALSRRLGNGVGSLYLPKGVAAEFREGLGRDNAAIRPLRKGMCLDRAIATSLEALALIQHLEIICGELILWASPQIDVTTVPEIRSSAVASLSATGLTPLAPHADAAREWSALLGADRVPVLHLQAFDDEEVAPPAYRVPLIEKTETIRLLIDAGGHETSLALVEPLLALRSKDCEVWVLYDGVLKPWMQPDFQIAEIPPAEIDMHLASVDMMLCAGIDDLAPLRLRRALALGVVPFTLDGTVPAYVSETGVAVVDLTALDGLPASRTALESDADGAVTAWAAFQDSEGDRIHAALDGAVIAAPQQQALKRGMSHALKLQDFVLFSGMVGDAGSDLDHTATDQPPNTEVRQFPVSEAAMIRMLGWAVSARGAADTDIVLSPSAATLVTGMQTRMSRNDVVAALNLPVEIQPGFEAYFLLPPDLRTVPAAEMLAIAVSGSTGMAALLPRPSVKLSRADRARVACQIARIKSIDGHDVTAVFPDERPGETSKKAGWMGKVLKRHALAAVGPSPVSKPETVIGFVEEMERLPGLVVALSGLGRPADSLIFELLGWEPVESPLPAIRAFLELDDGDVLIETKIMRYGRSSLSLDFSGVLPTEEISGARLFLPLSDFVKTVT